MGRWFEIFSFLSLASASEVILSLESPMFAECRRSRNFIQKNQNTCLSFTWWASTKFPLKTQETNSDSGGESIIGMREFCCCGLALLSKSLKPDTLLVLPSARQN